MSGGHFNPAVTIAIFMSECRRNFLPNFLVALLYISAQIVGGIIGVIIALFGLGLSPKKDVIYLQDLKTMSGPSIAYLCPANGCNVTGYFG